MPGTPSLDGGRRTAARVPLVQDRPAEREALAAALDAAGLGVAGAASAGAALCATEAEPGPPPAVLVADANRRARAVVFRLGPRGFEGVRFDPAGDAAGDGPGETRRRRLVPCDNTPESRMDRFARFERPMARAPWVPGAPERRGVGPAARPGGASRRRASLPAGGPPPALGAPPGRCAARPRPGLGHGAVDVRRRPGRTDRRGAGRAGGGHRGPRIGERMRPRRPLRGVSAASAPPPSP